MNGLSQTIAQIHSRDDIFSIVILAKMDGNLGEPWGNKKFSYSY